jgi:leucyl aminopeptidase
MTLEFALNIAAPATAAVDCVVVGAYADKTLTPAARALDEASGGRLTALAARGDVDGATGKVAMLHDVTGVSAPRVLVVGLGEPGKFAVPQYLKAIADAVRALKTGPVRSALLTLSEVEVPGRDAAWTIRQAAIAAGHAAYRYTATLGGLRPIAHQPDRESVYHLFVVQVAQRDALKRWLADRHIGSAIHYPEPVHHQPAYASVRIGPGGLQYTERAAREVLSLPLFPELDNASVDRVVSACEEFLTQ